MIYIELSEKNEFLLFLGSKFEKYGICGEEVKYHLRYCDMKKTIGTCILMNKSNLSVELEEKNILFPI